MALRDDAGQRNAWIGWSAVLACLPLIVIKFLAAFAVGDGPYAYAAWVEDDFFYYAVIAENIANSGRSTFDGSTLTNGYHPLWMAVCTILALPAGVHRMGFFVAVFLVQAGLILAGVLAFARLMRKAGAAGLVGTGAQFAATVFYGIAFATFALQGMEVVLLAPLMPLFLIKAWDLDEKPTQEHAFAALLALVAIVLSRLDAAVVFFPLCAALLVSVARRHGTRAVLRLSPSLLVLLPIPAYLALNHWIFRSALPISGLAKRLVLSDAPAGFSSLTFRSFVEWHNPNELLVPAAATALALAGLPVILFVGKFRRHAAGMATLLLALGAALFFLSAALSSDWRLWLWYYFSVVLVGSLMVAVIVDVCSASLPRLPARWLPVALAGGLVIFSVKANAWMLRIPQTTANALFARGIPLLDFAKTHPGRYAMGDGAGVVGFMLPYPVAQLEGLVNDVEQLDEIRRGTPIRQSLSRQKVDWYITSGGIPEGACTRFSEPATPGPRAPRMTDVVCATPAMSNTTQWISQSVWDVRDGLK